MKDVFGQAESWLKELEGLSSVAITQPHAAFCAFTHGVVSKWRYLFRTTGQTEESLQSLEDAIRYRFSPAVTGHSALSENERDIISLPARMGGLDLCNPKELVQEEYRNSHSATRHLAWAISEQKEDECMSAQLCKEDRLTVKKKPE